MICCQLAPPAGNADIVFWTSKGNLELVSLHKKTKQLSNAGYTLPFYLGGLAHNR